MTAAPPGWYDDGQGSTRWWDGTRWTGEVRGWTPPGGTEGAQLAGDPSGASSEPLSGAEVPATPDAVPRPARRGWLAPLLIGAGAGLFTAVLVLALMLLGPLSALLGVDGVPGASAPGSSRETGAPPDREHTEKELAAARAAVDAFAQAWWKSDCEAFFTTTTEAYREMMEAEDCEEFYVASRSYRESNETFFLQTIEATSIGNAIEVSVVEQYTTYYDSEGVPQDEPVDLDEPIDYLVVEVDGEWRVDNFFSHVN